ncbi:MAG: DNA polymerase III subunit alpha [Candidatus Lloydbacteria bacterium RIFCSPHIGHO2_01_FULL_41_20]|uniref:DNA polymerase III subunit alpha n=1 Tax=Candidatus Lloydbacteria bacterium RIFCSPHIGHO2_01_FULL_41_20 TaxID=1798657 RepID=A0A1G2CQZ9_9BACT|nr:MAG: DNA polymerase III subunit alpha [Candidatus Lloydbacteria bacterium RIFCSPHIGHO2_01_FULL_41_20]
MESRFIHLHTHSHYSLLDGMSKIEDMVKLAQSHKMPAIALTDHGNMYGAIEFYKTCRAHGIKPIIGVEAYIANRGRFDKEANIDNKRYHLTLLVKNEIGYKNLIKLVTFANLEGYYYKPRMDKELLKQYHEGIIALSGCLGGELSQALLNGKDSEAEAIAGEYRDIFSKENYFLEVMHHPNIEGATKVREKLIALSKKLNIPLVGTQDSHYLHIDDHKAHDTLLAVQTGTDTKDENRLTFGADDFSFINTKKALEYFKDIPEAVANTIKIADMCDLELKLGHWVFPDLKLGKVNYDELLKKMTYDGIPVREIKKTKEVEKRIEYELKIIRDKGYAPYFLVVADLIRFARESDILTTIRGSVAGSIVTYLLGVTTVNPLEYKLPFERFLNPERPSAPDIDMDFADNRRDEVIAYAKKKYGEDKVAQIGTFGTMMARGAVRDVARALGYPYGVGDKISRLIPMGSQGFPMTIDRAMEMSPELTVMYKNEKDTKEIIDLSKKLEGCARHISVHAAGVVISPYPLYEFVPTQLDPKGGKVITQYDMWAVEDAGLLKFDFLGIRNLAILGDAVKIVKKLYNIDIDIEKIPIDDKKTYEMLARGETMGLFQLNGSGMTRYLKELKPTAIHDINAMVALYRPGPMEKIPDYIKRKHNPKLVQYFDPRMAEILDQSYGVITYQDDVMLIAIKIAGYSWLEADSLRKAMGKKIPKEMAAQEEKFISGCIDGGMKPAKALELWKLIEPFAAYGFNKAHAASYGRVAYQTAYMKANFPVVYMASVLTADAGDIEKTTEIMEECKRMGIPVLPPNINESFGNFTVVNKKKENKEEIRFGLYSIKNLGTDIAQAIIDEREKSGKFKTFMDFLDRVKHKNLNKKSLESLVKSGSLDELGERGALLGNTEEALNHNREIGKIDQNQISLFSGAETAGPEFKLKKAPHATKEEKLAWEKELLGLYVSGHPLDKHREKLEKKEINIKKIKEELKEGMLCAISGIIEEVKIVFTKNNDQMAFIKLTDLSGTIETVAFPKIFQGNKNLFIQDKCISIKGRISNRNGETSILIEGVKELV